MTNEIELSIWDRKFKLSVEYDCYEGESVTVSQKKSLKSFLDHPDWLKQAKADVEGYCRDAVFEDDDNEKKDNIFSYVKPEYLFIIRDEKKPRVALICDYRYDPEHGLAIVFSNEGKVKIGGQDIIYRL